MWRRFSSSHSLARFTTILSFPSQAIFLTLSLKQLPACFMITEQHTKKPTTTARFRLWITMYLAFQYVFQFIFVIPNNYSVKLDYLHTLRFSCPRWKQAHCKALTISRFPQILPHHVSSVPQQKEPLYSEREVKLSVCPDALHHSEGWLAQDQRK